MNGILKNGNETLSAVHLNAIMAFASLISTQFYITSFSVVSDMKTDSFVNFQKIASTYNVETKFENVSRKLSSGKMEAFLILKNSPLDYTKIFKAKPKLIVTVLFTEEKTPTAPESLSKFVIPSATSFFLVQISRDPSGFSTTNTSLVVGKSFRIHRPLVTLPLKVFPMMSCGGESVNNQIWDWETAVDWNSFRKDIRDMRGVTITIAVASPRDKETTTHFFFRDKNSFFWKILAKYLGFTAYLHVEQVSPKDVKSMTNVYLKLLMTNMDGLGVLPVLTAERNQYLDCIITGLDSKFQLMVRTPQYVHSWQSILKPLTSETWLCLGLAIFFISIALRVVTYSQNLTSMDFPSCFLTIFGFVCGQGSACIPKTLSGRLVCYTALVFSFSIYQFYTSNFYSLLSTKEVSLPFTSLEQFLEKRSHHLYLHPDTAIYSQIKNSKNGTFRRVWEEILMKDPSHQLKADTRHIPLRKFCEGKGAILGLPYQITSMDELGCPLVAVNSGYFPTNIVLVVKKNFPFKSQFKFTQLRLLEGGISHKFKDDYLRGGLKRTTKTNVTNEPVSLKHVAFLIIFYAASAVFSFLLLGFEIVTFKTFLKPSKRHIKKPLFKPRERHFYLNQF